MNNTQLMVNTAVRRCEMEAILRDFKSFLNGTPKRSTRSSWMSRVQEFCNMYKTSILASKVTLTPKFLDTETYEAAYKNSILDLQFETLQSFEMTVKTVVARFDAHDRPTRETVCAKVSDAMDLLSSNLLAEYVKERES